MPDGIKKKKPEMPSAKDNLHAPDKPLDRTEKVSAIISSGAAVVSVAMVLLLYFLNHTPADIIVEHGGEFAYGNLKNTDESEKQNKLWITAPVYYCNKGAESGVVEHLYLQIQLWDDKSSKPVNNEAYNLLPDYYQYFTTDDAGSVDWKSKSNVTVIPVLGKFHGIENIRFTGSDGYLPDPNCFYKAEIFYRTRKDQEYQPSESFFLKFPSSCKGNWIPLNNTKKPLVVRGVVKKSSQ